MYYLKKQDIFIKRFEFFFGTNILNMKCPASQRYCQTSQNNGKRKRKRTEYT